MRSVGILHYDLFDNCSSIIAQPTRRRDLPLRHDRRPDFPSCGVATGDYRLLRGKSLGATCGPSYDEDSTQVLSSAYEMLGPYRLINKIGEGGMGVVYKAIDPAGDIVAIKVLRSHDVSERERLRREVSTLVRVRSRLVAAFLDADVDDERPYVVTSYVPGTPLDDVVENEGQFGAPRLARLGRCLADALGTIHEAGVVHRDLKPGNVLMVADDPVVIDFGIAYVADDSRLTSTGLVMGTPGYLSPEIVKGAEVTDVTDWWGWAATLAYAASGQPPFGHGSIPVILDRVTRGQADLSGVDERMRPLLQAALTTDPAARPTACEVLAELDVYAGGGHTGNLPLHVTRPAAATENLALPRAGSYATSAVAPLAWPTRDQPFDSDGRPMSSMTFGRFVPLADPRISQPARTGTLAALLAATVGFTVLWPTVGVVAVFLWALVARWCDKTVTSLVLRRFNAGRRKFDGIVVTVLSPWYGVVALFSTILTVLIPAFMGTCVTVMVAHAVSMMRDGSVYFVRPVPLATGMLIAILVMWCGPGGGPLRRGSRSIVRGVVRGKSITRIFVGVMIAIAVICGLWAMDPPVFDGQLVIFQHRLSDFDEVSDHQSNWYVTDFN